jgi:hypothetical protein
MKAEIISYLPMRQVEGIYFLIIGSAFPVRLVYVILAYASMTTEVLDSRLNAKE